MSVEKIHMVWNKRVIDITYNSDYSKAHRDIMGYRMAHLDIKSRDQIRLPITETGYRSHFIAATLIEDHGGVEKYVTDWLEDTSRSKAWQNFLKNSTQLSLF